DLRPLTRHHQLVQGQGGVAQLEVDRCRPLTDLHLESGRVVAETARLDRVSPGRHPGDEESARFVGECAEVGPDDPYLGRLEQRARFVAYDAGHGAPLRGEGCGGEEEQSERGGRLAPPEPSPPPRSLVSALVESANDRMVRSSRARTLLTGHGRLRRPEDEREPRSSMNAAALRSSRRRRGLSHSRLISSIQYGRLTGNAPVEVVAPKPVWHRGPASLAGTRPEGPRAMPCSHPPFAVSVP